MLMALQGPYMLTVERDDDLISPRRDGDNFGTMICFHRRHNLGDSHAYEDKDEFLRDLFSRSVGGGEQAEERYDRLVDSISEQDGTPYGSYAYARAVDEALLKEIRLNYVVLPLYLFDHSGLAMNTTGFQDPWDSGQVGWIYVSKEDILQEYDAALFTDELRLKAENLLRSEVETYDAYLRGEGYGYELYKYEEFMDSCWGFMGSLEDVCKDMAEYLPDECKGMTEQLIEVEHPDSMIKTLLKHARIQVEQAAKAFEHSPRQQAVGADAR